MARIRVSGLKGIKSSIRKEITKELRAKELRQTMGALVAESIKDNPQGSASKGTVKWRKRYERLNATDPKYNLLTINFTFTGELLEDLKKNVRVATERGKIIFTFANSDKRHRKYQGVTKKIGSRSKYSEIEKGLRDLDYDYPRLEDGVIEKITKFVREKILTALRKTFKV